MSLNIQQLQKKGNVAPQGLEMNGKKLFWSRSVVVTQNYPAWRSFLQLQNVCVLAH